MIHYVTNKQSYLYEHLIYEVHPFGYEQNLTETLPRKLSLDEIISRSDAKSFAATFVEHTRLSHNMIFHLKIFVENLLLSEFTISRNQNVNKK